MVEINLLPWRAWQQEYEKQQLIVGVIVLFIVLMTQYFLLHSVLKDWDEKAKQHLTTLVHEKEQLLTENKFAVPAFSRHAENMLHAYQRQTAALWQADVNNQWLPVCVHYISRQKQRIIITGEVDSANDLSNFLQNWKTRKQFSQLQVQQLQQIPQQERMHFQLLGMEANDTWSEQNREQAV